MHFFTVLYLWNVTCFLRLGIQKKFFFRAVHIAIFFSQGSLLPACMTIARSHKAPSRVVLLAIQTVLVLVTNVCNKDIVDLSGNKVEYFNILTSQSFVS